MNSSAYKFFGSLLVACAAAGCHSPTQYISPRVEGRVVDAQTHLPIRNVTITQFTPGQAPVSSANLKGATQLNQPAAIRSNAEGNFVIDSQSDLAFIRRVSWYSISLRFAHPGYDTYATSYTPTNATVSPHGEPVIKTGDIPLEPLAK